ncbi:putative polyketide synthase protein [Eutypa lata UCREL1]|uniref:Putative polyketide synthase protein n=1 Tax=Eutypa lata (strain UCR-EL1) TaxID=1287681 RepID=M7SL10_EUTLA|nr:putative polyketide synthase protein [Eutypa lata UCREL1]
MVAPNSASAKAKSTILLFGSQAVSFTKKSLMKLRSTIHGRPDLEWILETLQTLPKDWQLATKETPCLEKSYGVEKLMSLSNFFNESQTEPPTSISLSNVTSGPLVIITHLTELDGIQKLKHHGPVAIRLAMLAGALVDAKQAGNPLGTFTCLSVAWTSTRGNEELDRVLAEFPETYVSVVFDKKRVTVTTPTTAAPRLLEKVKAMGMTVADVPLHGMFHTQSHRHEFEDLVRFCDANSRFHFTSGADDLDEFWQLLCAAESQHIEVPKDRFKFKTPWREDDGSRKWFGNFIKDHDTFDHKFFKKSPREMSSTDPQHRLMLQAAYQAVEQSGYFGRSDQNKHIGCYIGVGLVDYERNIGCYAPTAYSATGNLKSFVAGKISHYFGWTGPGLTIDTACSSSAVAVHTACRAILSGECAGALVGGVNLMTSPEWFQNLAGASFLSPTGQCKPFDANADGYCRGEGVGAVFLKRYTDAVADGDQIFGVIAGSAVYQNENCTAITIPNAPSLSELFSNVVHRAGLEPKQISVVEAHGTGTPVGDPAEYESIRRVFGGPLRTDPLFLGSVKGLIGHTESASGIAALLKSLLMLHHGFVPPQPSFKTINPAINATPADHIEIPTRINPWTTDFRALLINNYGASGSNASLVVTQTPGKSREALITKTPNATGTPSPFWLCSASEAGLRQYASRLRRFMASNAANSSLTVESLAYQLSRQSNRLLDYGLTFTSSSIDDLNARLSTFEEGDKSALVIVNPTKRPVILCFGGQISTFIGLNEQLYKTVSIFRRHLDKCSAVCQSLAADTFFPEIFQRNAVGDCVKLQTMLFATQYSCAMSWIDCGVDVAAVIGHSFGELTALCISGILSLSDALKVIITRARLIRDRWGQESGSMLALMADPAEATRLLAEAAAAHPTESPATIACFNGPKILTIAGTAKAIEAVAEKAAAASTKATKLNVTNAFHSALVEPLLDGLGRLGEEVTFRSPVLHFERATRDEFTTPPSLMYFAEHMREPVYFLDAARRLSQRFPASIWLEAGSNSTITNLARQALDAPSSSVFQPINITSENALQFLSDATSNLWREGLRDVRFWSHHPVQSPVYHPLLLPPYQFENTKHWMDLVEPPQATIEAVRRSEDIEQPKRLWTLDSNHDEGKRHVRFRVSQESEHFQAYVKGHRIAQAALLCPSTLQLDIAMSSLRSLRPEFQTKYQPTLRGMENHAPMSLDMTQILWLEATSEDAEGFVWDWKMCSEKIQGRSTPTVHVTGTIVFRAVDDPRLLDDFERYERVTGHRQCLELLEGPSPDDIIQGRNIYKAFSDIVEYGSMYRGVQKITAKDKKSAGRVVKKYTNAETWLDSGLADCFCQVAGIYVNNMTDHQDTEMYISDRIDHWSRSPDFEAAASASDNWEVLVYHKCPSEKEFLSDVFVFNPRDGTLVEMILGIHYIKVSKAGLRKSLSRLVSNGHPETRSTEQASVKVESTTPTALVQDSIKPTKAPVQKNPKKSSEPTVSDKVKGIVCNLSGLERDQVKENSDLVELGIDSLMGMELTREIEQLFNCTLGTSELTELTDFESLVKLVRKTLGLSSEGEAEDVNGDGISHAVEGVEAHVNGNAAPHTNGLVHGDENADLLPMETILEAFKEVKEASDHFIVEYKLGNYVDKVLPTSNQLCIVHILDAFDKLGCPLRNAPQGQTLTRIQHLPRHQQFVDLIYEVLEKDARLIDRDGSSYVRTSTPAPTHSAEDLMQDLVTRASDHVYDHRLTYLCGSKLADCIVGDADGIQLIFGSPEGKEFATGMYGQSPINVAWIKQMEDFLQRLLPRISKTGVIKILELGAGTGGTTSQMLPLLASLGVQVHYTVSDISASLVAGARKRFKQYPWVEFRTFDIESPPPVDLRHSQHIVIATNCVHATRNLATSTRNIHDVLRPDGMLLMLEMTQQLLWVDLVFGLVEGWWLFDDGRKHALSPPSLWKQTLHSVGYGHVDWTGGTLPETAIQRIIVALASGPSELVHEYSEGFTVSVQENGAPFKYHNARGQQERAFLSKGIELPREVLAKIKVLATNSSQPELGLQPEEYEFLVDNVTHIVHSAWPMSITRTLSAFEPQFKAMRNLIWLAAEISRRRHQGFRVGFQFVSSIATVGNHPVWSGQTHVPEERMPVDSVIPVGYGDAKLVCERLLDHTLHEHPDRFKPMVVRVGQIAGSRTSGYWNPVEHLVFVVKSSQTLRSLPDLDGTLSWCPVNTVAAVLGELALSNEPSTYPVYHIENPVRQPWREMIQMMAEELGIPRANIVPFADWIGLVRQYPGSVEGDNPAGALVDFLERHFRTSPKFSSVNLDTVGFFARSVPDLRLLADVFAIRDDIRPPLSPPSTFSLKKATIALVRTTAWPKAGPDTVAAMDRAEQLLRAGGAQVEEVEIPEEFGRLPE